MRKYTFVISMLTLSGTIGFSQSQTTTVKKSQLEFLAGYNSGSLKNLAFAPVVRYDYHGPNYQIKYTRITKKEKLFEVDLDYLNTELRSDAIPALNADYSKIVLNFSSLKQVYSKNKFAIHLGLQSQTNVSSYFQWDVYDFQQKLGIAGRFAYQLDKKQSLSSKVIIPFMMWRISTFEENFYSLNRYQGVLSTTEYKYNITKHFDVTINYNFNYDRLQIPSTFRELQHQINLGINLKF